MANSTNRHLPEADDRFVEALLEEHARLGSGDDVALLALIRARTEEQPETGLRTSSSKFGVRQWLQVAAVVTLIGVALTFAFQYFSPGSTSSGAGNRVAASPADLPTESTDQQPEYTIRIRNVAAAPKGDSLFSSIDGLGLPVEGAGNDRSSLAFTSGWQTPLSHPLSTLPLLPNAHVEDSTSLSLDEIRSLLESGKELPAGAVTVSSLLEQILLTKPLPDGDSMQLSAATAPWNSEHQLVHVRLGSAIVDSAPQPPHRAQLAAEPRFPVFHHANAAEIDKALIRIAVEQLTEMTLGEDRLSTPQLIIEFNPAQVAAYRVLGYATNSAGQSAALYEIKAADQPQSATTTPGTNLRYQPASASQDLLTAQFNDAESSITREQNSDWQSADEDLKVSTAAALFASMVESAHAPSREQIVALEGLLGGAGTLTSESKELLSILQLWSERSLLEK